MGTLYYVSLTGHDYKGNGSKEKPWRHLQFAIFKAEDSSTIIVKPGTYYGTTRIKKTFKKRLLIKSQFPYLAKFTHNSRILAIVGGAQNIIIEGFEFTHINKNASPLLIHIDGYGSHGTNTAVSNITLRNNIFHDSYNNDLLKINNGASNIQIHCNLFYNQGDSDEHIDVNSVTNIDISDNIFFNDFLASSRQISNKSSSFIVIKDSNAYEDKIIGTNNVNIHRNIFFNWQGSHGHGYILIGEDGKPYYEASNIDIFNNLFLGNSTISMRSPLGIKGAKNINYFNNTITGNLPSNAYAVRINRENKNPINDNINLINNIWADHTGTMGMGNHEKSFDFSDTLPYQLEKFTLNNNLVFNGGLELPYSLLDKINIDDDDDLITNNPKFKTTIKLTSPIWISETTLFADNSKSIREVFLKIVTFFGIPHNKQAVQKSVNMKYLPKKDILGCKRIPPYSVGAYN